MLRDFIDGIPVDLAARLMPGRTRFRPGLLAHLHLHAGAQRRSQAAGPDRRAPERAPHVARRGRRRSWTRCAGRWKGCAGSHLATGSQYGRQTSYSEAGAASKREHVERMLAASGARVVWDLGANVGTYSTIAAGDGRRVIAFDQDASSVEHHWRSLSAEARASVLPLVMDLTNPSPALGWALEERRSLDPARTGRPGPGPGTGPPPGDRQQRAAGGDRRPVRQARAPGDRRVRAKGGPDDAAPAGCPADVFPDYTLDGFRVAFARHFTIVDEAPIADSARTLFLVRST